MSGRIEGKIALVVGAAQGIGEAIATRFVEEGAKVIGGIERDGAIYDKKGIDNNKSSFF